mgnify:CR=1 FL=1
MNVKHRLRGGLCLLLSLLLILSSTPAAFAGTIFISTEEG